MTKDLIEKMEEIIEEIHHCGFNQNVDCPKDNHRSDFIDLLQAVGEEIIGGDEVTFQSEIVNSMETLRNSFRQQQRSRLKDIIEKIQK